MTNDPANVWWLTRETMDIEDEHAVDRLSLEMVEAFDESTVSALDQHITEEYGARRRVWSSVHAVTKGKPDQFQGHSVATIEQNIIALDRTIHQLTPGSSERMRMEFLVGQLRHVLERVRSRIHEYLVRTEQRLIFEQRTTDVFDQHISVVNGLLEKHAPEVLAMFNACYDRIEDPQPENLHQAGTTCRRILKAVADHLYPSRLPIRDSKGQERIVGEEHYVNRLLALAEERLPDTVGEAWEASFNDLVERLNGLNRLASKSVHAPAFALFEARHCAMQTYLVVGDLLRLEREQQSEST